MQEPEKVVSYASGPSVLINQLCHEIGFEDLLNDLLPWDPIRCHLSPGTRLKALVINILTSKTPLYRVEHFYREQDVEWLFGAGVQAHDFNDDALGRALDKLHQATPWKVYSTLALEAAKTLDLSLGTLQNDTTSFSLYGEYGRESQLNIDRGHSKDHRPDLKHILLGMSVTPERIPILANVENGNLDDKTWNFTFIQKMREALSLEMWENLTYVADSALITQTNLQRLNDLRVPFVSRLPDTFKVSEEVKRTAWAADEWQKIGPVGKGPDAAVYRFQPFERKIQGLPYRLMVIHSNKLEKRKAERFAKQLTTEETILRKALQNLEKTVFHCEADAEAAIQAFTTAHASDYFHWTLGVETQSQPRKRNRRGRPKKGEVPVYDTVYVPSVRDFRRNEAAIEAEKRRLSTFVLITNQKRELCPDPDVLKTYKGQEAVETRFRLLKNPQFVDGFYLKTPERIEALGIVLVMAMLLYGLLEHRVRQRLAQEDEPLKIHGRRTDYQPTGQVILNELQQIKVIAMHYASHTARIVSGNVDTVAQRLVRLAGYEMAIYTKKPVETTNV